MKCKCILQTAWGGYPIVITYCALHAAAKDLLDAANAKLANCRENGDCSDPALLSGEYCSGECAALAKAVDAAEGKTQPAEKVTV
jgi:hypothetical protein